MKLRLSICFSLFAALLVIVNLDSTAKEPPKKKEVIPHAQDKPPGPPLSPQEALKKMTGARPAFASNSSPPSRTSSIPSR